MMQTVAICCQTIEDEINAIIGMLPDHFPIVWVESGLHNYPTRLRDRIQEEIDELNDVANILLLFGYCGNSVHGLKSSNAQLILPKVDDCISLLLGGDRIRKELSSTNRAYFMTDGWLRYENNIYHEYEHCKEKYGINRTLRIFKSMLTNYSALNFIDTGTYSLEQVMAKTQELADNLNLQQQVVPGTLSIITKAFNGEWDEDFLIVPPGMPLVADYCTTPPNQI